MSYTKGILDMIYKYIILPLILVGCTAPVTDPPAHACSPRLDGEPTFCPPLDEDFPLKPKPLLVKEEIRGEIDIYEPMHWHQMQMMFQRNARRTRMEQNATKPSDAINLSLIPICRCRRLLTCRSRWSPYH